MFSGHPWYLVIIRQLLFLQCEEAAILHTVHKELCSTGVGFVEHFLLHHTTYISKCKVVSLCHSSGGCLLLIFFHPSLQLWSEMTNQSLNRPCSSIPQSTDGVSLNLLAQFIQHVDLLCPGIA